LTYCSPDENAKQHEIEQLRKELKKLKKATRSAQGMSALKKWLIVLSLRSDKEHAEDDNAESSAESEEENEYPVTLFPTSVRTTSYCALSDILILS
jgi:hypothetical protein